jgi:hypothetical protein
MLRDKIIEIFVKSDDFSNDSINQSQTLQLSKGEIKC